MADVTKRKLVNGWVPLMAWSAVWIVVARRKLRRGDKK
jgi:hypothetical protein